MFKGLPEAFRELIKVLIQIRNEMRLQTEVQICLAQIYGRGLEDQGHDMTSIKKLVCKLHNRSREPFEEAGEDS